MDFTFISTGDGNMFQSETVRLLKLFKVVGLLDYKRTAKDNVSDLWDSRHHQPSVSAVSGAVKMCIHSSPFHT